jgi:23S rRNA pseudouridine1911/1915/1917 synthase
VTETEGAGHRVDAFLTERLPPLSRARIQRLIAGQRVTVDGNIPKASHRLTAGEKVAIEYEPDRDESPAPESIPLQIIHHDLDIVVLDKPSGLVVHPGAGRTALTLVNALLHLYPELAELEPVDRPGIVHRLDKETSGVMVVARSQRALLDLQMQFKTREVRKIYLGLVWGCIRHAEGSVSWPIGRHSRHRQRISVKTDKPRSAETRYTLRRAFRDFSYLEIQPVTGRMHQIRVHMAAAGHPLVGDARYGRRRGSGPSPRLFLHAASLAFRHPGTGEPVEYRSPLPKELQDVLDRLEGA